MSEKNTKDKPSFKNTLNLPKTDFPQRANAKIKELEILERWESEKLYAKATMKNEGTKKTFVLHDGPPFANGHMHMGHALNRTLKDVICKFKRMTGHNVVSSPGWDCHGLPIELKVGQQGEVGSDAKARVAFKKKCREYAKGWIEIQKEEIVRLGVVTDWEHFYETMSPQYEASILKSFAQFVEKGFIERKGKTVPWCASCKTVLASAEIEHKDKKDPSCYILFPFEKEVSQKHFPDINLEDINLLVWTTTPWTIPLNRAVVLHPTANYVLLQGSDDNAFVVGEKLADEVCEKVGIEKKVLATFPSTKFDGATVGHPYIDDQQVPIILDNMVLLADGTACVHSAPGCGPEDYFLGVKNGLEIFSPLSPDGKYTEGILPEELVGMPVSDGQIWSIKKIHEKGRLLHKHSIKHSYPHCWRCHEPLIFRATEQWFCDLEKEKILSRAIEVAEKLSFVPDWGKTRLTSSMASRTEWCLSRQRQWGVPIVAILCKNCDSYFLDPDFIRTVALYVAKDGVEFWDEVSIEDLVKRKILPENFCCAGCKTSDVKNFEKETDILDVWFESGVSHTAVKEVYPSLQIPADVYFEGSDQHRGWFQSSHLSSMIMYNKACAKKFVTHAFVLDEHALKMSKSKGNVVSPQDVIEKQSADILRLWVAGSDFESDIIISPEILKNVSEVYRKIRNTCRFMISNLYDFDISKDAVAIEEMEFLDQYALASLQALVETVTDSYENYKFTQVFHAINRYCTNDLSSFYLDILKDRLYTEQADGHMRRSSQMAMYKILDTLTRLIAPILSFLAEEVWQSYEGLADSIHLQNFPVPQDVWSIVAKKRISNYQIAAQSGLVVGTADTRNTNLVATFAVRVVGWWNLLESIRPELLKAIELQREKSLNDSLASIKHSLEAKVTVYFDKKSEEGAALQAIIDYLSSTAWRPDAVRFFKDFIIVSQFEFADSPDGLDETGMPWLRVRVEHADGTKCPRCWQWEETEHVDGLCERCKKITS